MRRSDDGPEPGTPATASEATARTVARDHRRIAAPHQAGARPHRTHAVRDRAHLWAPDGRPREGAAGLL